MVFNYLHVCHDSRYKSSIDNGPIYSIIDPTNAQMGKSNAGCPLFRELPDDARQQGPGAESSRSSLLKDDIWDVC